MLIPLEARDENGDGLIDLTVAPDNDCRNPCSLLNVLWVFEGKPRLDLEQLLRGRSGALPWRTSPAATTAAPTTAIVCSARPQ